jgi:hypothetical protein
LERKGKCREARELRMGSGRANFEQPKAGQPLEEEVLEEERHLSHGEDEDDESVWKIGY